MRADTDEDPGWGVPARIGVTKRVKKCGEGVQGKKRLCVKNRSKP